MIVSRPVRFTDSMDAHRRLLEALGGHILSDFGTWVVYALAHGRVALHGADDTSPAGSTMLGFEADDLHLVATSAQAAAPRGTRIRVTEATHGTAAMVTTADGLQFTVDALTIDPDHASPEPESPTQDQASAAAADDVPRAGQVSVLPLWLTAQPDQAAETLAALGARERIRSESGDWVDFRADAGLVAVHRHDSTEVALSFEYTGEVDELLEPLQQAGFEASVIDEAFGRTLRIPDPDLPDAEIWINQTQSDLYGYRRAE